MKIAYISDLHLDFWIRTHDVDSNKFYDKCIMFIEHSMVAIGGEVLIIAGDIGHYNSQNMAFMKILNEFYDDILFVTGNHDMYLVSGKQQDRYKGNSFNRLAEMKEMCDQEEHIHYLDGDTIEINGFKFGGCAMSWDNSYYEQLTNTKQMDNSAVLDLFSRSMNDSRLILELGKSFDPYAYQESELAKLKSLEDVDVMITHYSPTIPDMMNPLYKNETSSTFYYFDGDTEIERIDAKYWIFGHTHDNYKFERYNTTFLCNPLGYPNENPYATVQTFEMFK